MSSRPDSCPDRPLAAALAKHYEEVKAFIRRKVGCADLAADAAQDAWLKLATAAPTQPVDNPRAYLFRAAGNLAVDAQRGASRTRNIFAEPEAGETAADPAPSPEAQLLARERLRRLDAALDELPPHVKQALLLHRVDGLPHGEVGARLGVSESMAAKYVAQALRHCRRRLGAAGLLEKNAENCSNKPAAVRLTDKTDAKPGA